MSKTTDYLITLQEDLEHASTLREVLELDVKYCGETGTDMVVQDLFRQEKYDYVMKGLEAVNLDRFAFKFYNYSMQGKCQIYFDNDTYARLVNNLGKLSEYYNLPLTVKSVDSRMDAVVLTLEV